MSPWRRYCRCKQHEPIERLYEELILNPIIYIGADLSGDVVGTYAALLGIYCGPLVPLCSPVLYVGGNFVVGNVVEGGLDWVRDVSRHKIQHPAIRRAT